MKHARTHVAWVWLAVSLVSAGLAARSSQLGPAQSIALSSPVPLDPQVSTGVLTNGLHYYVRANKQPLNRAELRLAVNAGSILEDDDQRGLAHLVEHMCFDGTTHFPKKDILAFMQSLGMRFGADVNAYTSFDETVYQLTIPTDKPEVIDRALLVLEDWAHGVTFDPAELDKERDVVVEEWRLGRGAGARLQDKEFPVLLQGSRYADRLAIGLPDIVKTAPRARLMQFYTDWYRPDLMAVAVVGDVDTTAVEGLIRTHFGSIPAARAGKPRPHYSVADHPGTSYAINTDKEMTETSVGVYRLLPSTDHATIAAYRAALVEQLFSSMLSARFVETAQKPDAPFLGASGGRGRFVRERDSAVLSAAVKDDGVARGLDAIFTEAQRVVTFGFTPSELDRQKTNLLRRMARAVAEKDRQESANLVDELVSNFLSHDPVPDVTFENDLAKRFVPGITLAETNALAKDWFPDDDRTILVRGPDKAGLTLPDRATLAGVIAAIPGKTLQKYVDTAATLTLLDSAPTAGSVVRTATKPDIGITEWELSNGVKVSLKPTTFKEDEILFQAFSPGGSSLADDADYIPAANATTVISTGGLGKLGLADLRKVTTGRLATSSPYVSELEEGLRGGASKPDLETLFQLIYLDFTAPRADPTMFGVMQSQLKTSLANQTASPAFAFNAARTDALFGHHPRRQPTTPATIDAMNLDKSMAFYKDRFADASAFHFVFVGSFDVDTMKPLVEKYLASLPSLHRQETWKDVGAHYATGVVERRVERGIDPKSQVSLSFTGPFVWDQTQRVAIRALADIMTRRLTELIREQLGGTYGITVSANYTKIPREEYLLSVDFGCDPARTDDLIARVLAEIAVVQSTGPTPQQVADEKTTLLQDFDQNTRQNTYFLQQIYLKYLYGEDPSTLLHVPDYYGKLDVAAVQEAARTYFNAGNYVKVTLMPEKKTP